MIAVLNCFYLNKNGNKTENGNGKYVKDSKSQPKSRKQPKATDGSSMQQETTASGNGPQLAPKYKNMMCTS